MPRDSLCTGLAVFRRHAGLALAPGSGIAFVDDDLLQGRS